LETYTVSLTKQAAESDDCSVLSIGLATATGLLPLAAAAAAVASDGDIADGTGGSSIVLASSR